MHATWSCSQCGAHGEIPHLEIKHITERWHEITAEHRRQSSTCWKTSSIRLQLAEREEPEQAKAAKA